jgi:hypothetical protein
MTTATFNHALTSHLPQVDSYKLQTAAAVISFAAASFFVLTTLANAVFAA